RTAPNRTPAMSAWGFAGRFRRAAPRPRCAGKWCSWPDPTPLEAGRRMAARLRSTRWRRESSSGDGSSLRCWSTDRSAGQPGPNQEGGHLAPGDQPAGAIVRPAGVATSGDPGGMEGVDVAAVDRPAYVVEGG